MAHVQRKHPEFLNGGGLEASPVVCPDVGRVAQKTAAFRPGSGHPSAELERRLDDGSARGTDAWQCAQLGFSTFRQPSQIPEVGEQFVSDFNHILAMTA